MNTQTNDPDILFSEVQRMPRVLLWLACAAVCPLWYLVVAQVLLGHPMGSKPAPDAVLLLLWLLIGVTLPLAFAVARLETEVRSDGLRLRYPPFMFRVKHFHPLEIMRCEARSYRPIREYGGWGIRWWFGRVAYSVRGNRGAELTLANGRIVMVGSQRADELADALRRVMH